MEAKNLVNVSENERLEAMEIENRIKQNAEQQQQDRKRLQEIKKKSDGVTFKTFQTKSGRTGLLVNGLGKPQFFYKSHFLQLIGDSNDSEQLRQRAREWVQQNDAELTAKEEE
jgi:hypothetical protein